MKTNQIYVATVQIYQGGKIVLGGWYTLRFRPDKEGYYTALDCRILKDGQKTLSSMKPNEVGIESELTVDDVGGRIKLGDRFTIIDIDGKLGKGKITEVVRQL